MHEPKIEMFRVGQQVRWSSQSGGHYVQKVGTVVRVVGKGESPISIWKDEFSGHKRMFDGFRVPGNSGTGYLVEVPGGTPQAKLKLYLPYTSKLFPLSGV